MFWLSSYSILLCNYLVMFHCIVFWTVFIIYSCFCFSFWCTLNYTCICVTTNNIISTFPVLLRKWNPNRRYERMARDPVDFDNLKKERTVLCDYPSCKKMFSTSCAMRRHYKVIHLQIKKFVCMYCGKETGQRSDLKSHLARIHPDRPQFLLQ